MADSTNELFLLVELEEVSRCKSSPDGTCAYFIRQLNVCLVFREVDDRTASTDVENCFIIIRTDSGQEFCILEKRSGLGIVQEALRVVIVFKLLRQLILL